MSNRKPLLLGLLILVAAFLALGWTLAGASTLPHSGPVAADLHKMAAGPDYSLVTFQLGGQPVTYRCDSPTETWTHSDVQASNTWDGSHCTAPGHAAKALKVVQQQNYYSPDYLFIYSGTHRLTCKSPAESLTFGDEWGPDTLSVSSWTAADCLVYPR